MCVFHGILPDVYNRKKNVLSNTKNSTFELPFALVHDFRWGTTPQFENHSVTNFPYNLDILLHPN